MELKVIRPNNDVIEMGGSIVYWRTGEPEFDGEYLVTYQYREDFTRVCTALYYSLGVWRNKDWDEVPSKRIIAWCKLSDIEPYKEEKK